MSASELQRAEWLDPRFWERLDALERRHQQIRSEQNEARRELERLSPTESAELREAWRHYCEATAELDQSTAELEALRTRAE